MFNPTVIRTVKKGDKTGIVIINNISDDIYFQIYVERENNVAFLEYIMPWSSEQLAIEDFNRWANNEKSPYAVGPEIDDPKDLLTQAEHEEIQKWVDNDRFDSISETVQRVIEYALENLDLNLEEGRWVNWHITIEKEIGE